MTPLNFRKIYVWKMSGHYWDKVMSKYDTISMSLANVHQRFLDKRNKHKHSGKRRPGFIKNWFIN